MNDPSTVKMFQRSVIKASAKENFMLCHSTTGYTDCSLNYQLYFKKTFYTFLFPY